MSAPTFLVSPELLSGVQVGSQVHLPETVAHHMKVARIAVGEEVHLVDGQGTRVSGSCAHNDCFDIAAVTHESLPRLRITVAQALIKGDRLERAVEMMTEVGATAFIPWSADHSVVKWAPDKAGRNRLKWVNLVHAASEQSRRSFVPYVEPPVNSKELFARFSDFDQVILLEETQGAVLAQSPSGSVLIVVGPEGGLSRGERELFKTADNCVQLTVGNSVLRSATAGVVVMSHLFTRSGEWDSRPDSNVER